MADLSSCRVDHNFHGIPVPRVRWMHSKQFLALLKSGEALELGRPLKNGTVAVVHDGMPESGAYDAPTPAVLMLLAHQHECAVIRYAMRNLNS